MIITHFISPFVVRNTSIGIGHHCMYAVMFPFILEKKNSRAVLSLFYSRINNTAAAAAAGRSSLMLAESKHKNTAADDLLSLTLESIGICIQFSVCVCTFLQAQATNGDDDIE
jgi:hypothetical protein